MTRSTGLGDGLGVELAARRLEAGLAPREARRGRSSAVFIWVSNPFNVGVSVASRRRRGRSPINEAFWANSNGGGSKRSVRGGGPPKIAHCQNGVFTYCEPAVLTPYLGWINRQSAH